MGDSRRAMLVNQRASFETAEREWRIQRMGRVVGGMGHDLGYELKMK